MNQEDIILLYIKKSSMDDFYDNQYLCNNRIINRNRIKI